MTKKQKLCIMRSNSFKFGQNLTGDNMIRVILVFAILAALIHFGIMGWRSMAGKERWSLTKSLGYSIIVSLLAIVVMMFMVVLF